jgi:hypothetical protein
MRSTRVVLVVSALLAGSAFLILTLAADDTATFFAWTIEPPVAAAFVGAGFGAGVLLVVASLRRNRWPEVRVLVLAVTVFVLVMTVATLAHMDRFHFAAMAPIARFGAWLWTAVYVITPIVMIVVIVREERAARAVEGAGLGDHARLSRWARWAFAVQGALLGGAGLVMLVAPGVAAVFWPWVLTPLSGRATSAAMLAIGVAAIAIAMTDDGTQATVGATGYGAFGVLGLLAMVRFPDQVSWDRGIVLAVLLVSLVAVAVGLLVGRRTRSQL